MKLYLNARGFYLAARLLDSHPSHKSLLMWPMISNETFALELFLKCLHRIRGHKHRGHNTEKLFNALGTKDQITIDRYLLEIVQRHKDYTLMCEKGVRFDAGFVVQRARTAFETARYWFEGKLPDADDDGFVSNAGIGNLCDAIRKLILDSNPTWTEHELNFRFALPGQGQLPS